MNPQIPDNGSGDWGRMSKESRLLLMVGLLVVVVMGMMHCAKRTVDSRKAKDRGAMEFQGTPFYG